MEKPIIKTNDKWEQSKVEGFTSQALLDLENGTVKLVRVASKSVYPEHQHPQKTEYAYVIEGTLTFEIDGVAVQAKTGDFQVFPIGKKHKILNNGNDQGLLLIGAINH